MDSIKELLLDFFNHIKTYNNEFKAFLAGICISIGCICYLSVENKIIGAFLFSTGLLTILSYNLNLYTGKIGLVSNIIDLIRAIEILSCNIMGCLFTRCLLLVTPIESRITQKLDEIAMLKFNTPLHQMFLLGIICGVLMSFATKKKDNFIVSILSVVTFILIGAEHSVADAFYLSSIYDMELYFSTILIVAVGNAVGAIFTNIIIDSSNDQEKCANNEEKGEENGANN